MFDINAAGRKVPMIFSILIITFFISQINAQMGDLSIPTIDMPGPFSPVLEDQISKFDNSLSMDGNFTPNIEDQFPMGSGKITEMGQRAIDWANLFTAPLSPINDNVTAPVNANDADITTPLSITEPNVTESANITENNVTEPVSSDPNDIDVGPGESIQAAIDKAEPGDNIWVKSGTYFETINVNKNICLGGWDTGLGNPIIDAGQGDDAVTISADGIVIECINIQNSNGAGIRVLSKDNFIGDIYFTNNKYGIYLGPGSYNNTIDFDYFYYGKYGLYLDNSMNNKITLNQFIKNTNAIFIISSNYNGFFGNVVNDCQDYGIYLDASRYNKFDGNLVVGNYGAFLQESYNNTLSNNWISENRIYNAYDNGLNLWVGNFYGNCTDEDKNDVCDSAYSIPGGSNIDYDASATGKIILGARSRHKQRK